MMRYIILFIVTFFMHNAAFSGSYDEYFYTAAKDGCITEIEDTAYNLAKRIAHGEPLFVKYSIILQSDQHKDDFFAEPIDLSYALFLIADRLGDKRAKTKLNWLSNYINDSRQDLVSAIVYRKYARSYLRKCFDPKNAQEQAQPEYQNIIELDSVGG